MTLFAKGGFLKNSSREVTKRWKWRWG